MLPFGLDVAIPFIGQIGIIEIVLAVLGGIFGFIMGSSIRSAIKYIVVIALFIGVLVFIGIMQTDVLVRLAEMAVVLRPLIPDIIGMELLQSASLPLIGFVLGFAWGAFKG